VITVTFIASSLVVIMTPGPDLAFVTQLLLRHRRREPAYAAAAGMITAGVVQASMGLAGVSLLLRTRPDLFTALRWTGSALLLWWGARALRAALSAQKDTHHPRPVQLKRAYVQGFACTATNPKVGLFLVAFLPQFVPRGADPGPALGLLATVYLAMGLTWLLVWITVASRLGGRGVGTRTTRIANLVTGAVLAGFAVRLALG
jgi:threonine/homoserine/homoserine lactone efflux protein